MHALGNFSRHLILNVQKQACLISARISRALVILAGLSAAISSNSFNNLFSAKHRSKEVMLPPLLLTWWWCYDPESFLVFGNKKKKKKCWKVALELLFFTHFMNLKEIFLHLVCQELVNNSKRPFTFIFTHYEDVCVCVYKPQLLSNRWHVY